jgi:hypothetical protein
MGSIGSKSKKKGNMSSTPKAGAAGKLLFYLLLPTHILTNCPPSHSSPTAASGGRNRRLSIAATGKFLGLELIFFGRESWNGWLNFLLLPEFVFVDHYHHCTHHPSQAGLPREAKGKSLERN